MAFKNEIKNIEKIYEGIYKDLPFMFENKPKSEQILDVQAFYITKHLRNFYDLQKNIPIEEIINRIKTNKKFLSVDLASKVLALEECDKRRLVKEYFPSKAYGIIIEHCEKSLDKACNELDKLYQENFEKESKSLKDMKQEILKYVFEALKKGKTKIDLYEVLKRRKI